MKNAATDFARELLGRLRSFFRKAERDDDFDAELATHLQMAIDENLERGLSPGEARRQALIRIGGVDQAKELHRESRGLPLLDTLVQDVRYSFRTLRRDAALTTFAVLIIGLGVGASSTVFSVVNALLLRPLPFEEPESLVWIQSGDGAGMSGQTAQVGHLLYLQEQNKSFADVAGYFAFYGDGDSKLTGDGEPVRLTNVPVTERFFPLLGVKPQIGRLFTPEECKRDGPPAVLLSHTLWTSRFASDPGIVGKTIDLNDTGVTVIGVLPASFDFGAVFTPGNQVDLFSPFALDEVSNRWGNTMAIVGRLKPGATLESARAELAVLAQGINEAHPNWNTFDPIAGRLREHVSGNFRSAMILLACAVCLVMLIVSANLSNLLLARAATREKEIGIRSALGAGRWRLVRQMLTESVTLSFGGAILGLALAVGGIRVLSRLDAMGIPLLGEVQVDAGVLAFTLLLAVGTGVIFGLAPALRVSGSALRGSLSDSSRGSTEGKGQGWLRGVLVVCETAMACVLLVGAGLLLRSFVHLLDVDLGFQPESAIAMRVDPSTAFRHART